jgi:hypothetical protein
MKSGTDVNITDGDWRITTFYYTASNRCPCGDLHHYELIQHYCTAGRGENPIRKGWVGMYYNVNNPLEPCYVCNQVPSEGIQAVFWMLKEGSPNDI